MVYRTMQGREIDMDKLRAQNELMPAIGNMKVNARGDELGPGGQIIRRREEIVGEYYDTNPNARGSRTAAPAPAPEPVEEKQQPVAKTKKLEIDEEE
jgi:hypothetical protein